MKWFVILVLTLFFLFEPFCVKCQTATLTIKIEGVKEKHGSIMIAVFDNEQNYLNLNEMADGAIIAADSAIVSCTFTNLSNGLLAVSVFHDYDDNRELNRNWLGMPQEGYAFSNNYYNALKPASFEDAVFYFTQDTTLYLKLNY
jgi:uncharacterized protein (DUF2141 family)